MIAKIAMILYLLFSFAYCVPISNSTEEIANSNEERPNTMDVVLKILKVSGISIAGGGLVFLLPIAFYLVLLAIGFTGAGMYFFKI